jgi:hypothetical protein
VIPVNEGNDKYDNQKSRATADHSLPQLLSSALFSPDGPSALLIRPIGIVPRHRLTGGA